jgi:predicted ATPase
VASFVRVFRKVTGLPPGAHRKSGRDEEIDLLLRRWARATAGDGQIVLVSGEPGIGKSRITAELAERFRAESHFHLRYFCSPYCRDSALYPLSTSSGMLLGSHRTTRLWPSWKS